MIRCRVCGRHHDESAAACECGADLGVEGVPAGDADVFDVADLGDSVGELEDLPALDLPGPEGDDGSNDTLRLPDESLEASPLPPPLPEPESEPVVSESPGSDPTELSRPAPPRRDFAVQPREDSGEEDRGESPGHQERPVVADSLDPVPRAPVIDPDLEHSVFAEDEATWSGAGALRAELDRDRAGGTFECPTCGREVSATAHFCKCGRAFDIPVREPIPVEPEPSRLTSLWRRITGTGRTTAGDNRSWGQRARDTGARRGMSYATRMSARTRLGRIGLAFGGGAGLLLALGPLRNEVRELPNLFVPATVEEVDWTPADRDCDGPATSDVQSEVWQARWSEDDGVVSGIGDGCDGVLRGSWPTPVDIDRLRVEVGPTSGQLDGATLGQPVRVPHQLELVLMVEGDDSEPIPIELADTAETQDHRARADDVIGFELRVLSVQSRESSWPELDVVQLGRIAFVQE